MSLGYISGKRFSVSSLGNVFSCFPVKTEKLQSARFDRSWLSKIYLMNEKKTERNVLFYQSNKGNSSALIIERLFEIHISVMNVSSLKVFF